MRLISPLAHFISLPAIAGVLLMTRLLADDYLTPEDVYLPTDAASRETIAQSAAKKSLRWFGLDFFPHATVTTVYDDNIFIQHEDLENDVEWTLSPGLTLAAGDIAAFMPGSVSLDQVRNFLGASLGDQNSVPRRYIAVDYTPGINLFMDNHDLNNVDHLARLSAGYAFGHLALGLDQDYSYRAVKDNSVGGRLTQELYRTELRGHYEPSDRSSFDVNGIYYRFGYADSHYQGYQEFKNEDWFNRYFGTRLSVGFGAAFGYVDPDESASQTYEQALLRANYHITGNLDLRPRVGVEFRQYSRGEGDSAYPVFSLAAIYHPREWTTLTLEGHRRDQPSYLRNANYSTIGVSGGLRQMVRGRLGVNVIGGYDNMDFKTLSGISDPRTDDVVFVKPSLDYEFNSHVKAVVYYTYQDLSSTIERYTYVNNLVGLQLGWRY